MAINHQLILDHRKARENIYLCERDYRFYLRLEASRHFRNKKREYLEDTVNKLAMNSKNNNIRDLCRGMNEFKKGYHTRSNLVKDENGDLLGDSHNIWNMWKNYVVQLLNVHRVSDVRQIEIHTVDPICEHF
jgi:hypothetical protein